MGGFLRSACNGCLALAGLLAGAASPLYCQELRTREFLEAIGPGFTHLYALEYPEARAEFERLEQRFPEHPGPPLYLASAIWLQELFGREELDLDKFIAPGYFTEKTERRMPAAELELFRERIERSRRLSEQILAKDPRHIEARYFLGAVYGIEGAFAMTIERSLQDAFRFGKKAYQYQLQIVEEDPDFADAYMSVGLYEYVVGSLPWYIKWLATIIGYRGSKERGFEYLGRAAERATFVADDSQVLQMVLFVRENMNDRALANARLLHQKHPANFLLELNIAQLLERLGRLDEAVETYLAIERKAVAGRPNYGKLPLPAFRLQVGRRLLGWNRLQEAREILDRALADPDAGQRQRALLLLTRGKVLDRLGQRAAAVADYQAVLALPDFEGSHKQAREGVRRPLRQ